MGKRRGRGSKGTGIEGSWARAMSGVVDCGSVGVGIRESNGGKDEATVTEQYIKNDIYYDYISV